MLRDSFARWFLVCSPDEAFLVVVGWLAIESISAAELPDASSEKAYPSSNDNISITFSEMLTEGMKLLDMIIHVIHADLVHAVEQSASVLLLFLGNAHTDARVMISANEGSEEKTATCLTSSFVTSPF
ncbi:hypothetical protein E4T39_02352 [Aureobasidium subglaciale]|nr:hypothetical protein E4T39_02352 [Aureobasidium subglaciale]